MCTSRGAMLRQNPDPMRPEEQTLALRTDGVITKAETRVAIAYALGDIGKEVGKRLGIAHGTVVRHTQNIYEKAGIRHSTNALVAWFLTENYGLNLSELGRRVGSGALMILFCLYTFGDADNDFSARRARRARRNEIEMINEA